MSKFTLLSAEQILGTDKLDIIRKRGTKAEATDYAILSYAMTDYHNMKSPSHLCSYWTKTLNDEYSENNEIIAIDYGGDDKGYQCDERSIAARPAIRFSSFDSKDYKIKKTEDGILEVEYGHYPQQAADQKTQKELEFLFNKGELQTTGHHFTTGDERLRTEYEYKGKEYIRTIAWPFWYRKNHLQNLSNKEAYSKRKPVWVEVQPVKWWLDEKTGIMLSEKALFANIGFFKTSEKGQIYKGNFNDSDIKQYLDEYFAKDLTQHLKKTKSISRRPSNPYGFDYSKVSEEDIIKGALESDVPVFLHGASSDGKSSRVKQYDKDCEIIYLRNATPDSLNGKSVYNPETGEMMDVPPTWLKKLTKKCEDEQNKLHIVFFDELSNALPSIQGMAFNIVLDKEVNGKWKLPDNARIVAAGNELEDSLSANQISEPLFNRFAHVYIHTTAKDWLKWAATPKENYEKLDYEMKEPELKIHPSIYAYIALKGDAVLRTPYNGKTPNADPRKWEMASNVLYTTKKPEMLRSLIGEELTDEFVNFCQQQDIKMDDALSGSYNQTESISKKR